MSLAFKRMYVDIPPDTHDGLKILAQERGMSQKALVAALIQAAISDSKPATRKRKNGSKKK